MEARILKWQEKTKERNTTLDELDKIKQDSMEKSLAERREATIREALSKIPFRYQGKTFDDFKAESHDQIKIKNIITKYAETFSKRLKDGNNIIFSGEPGTGKTFLSLILYQCLVKRHFNCVYEPSLNFLRILQDKKFLGTNVFNTLLHFYIALPFLIIDEVTEGSGRSGDLTHWEQELLFKLIDGRYQKNHCTLIISNHSVESIRSRLSSRVLDRFLEKGIQLIFNWSSFRK